MNQPAKLRIAIVGAGSIGSAFAYKLARGGHEVTLVARNSLRRSFIEQNGLVARSRPAGRTHTAHIGVVPRLQGTFDLVVAAVQRPQIEDLIPELAANDSSQIMLMFNCASGAGRWALQLGPHRLLWGFPALLADMREQVLEYLVVPSVFRFAQITTIGRHDGLISPELTTIRDCFTAAGIPTVTTTSMDAWLKTHAAYMAPIMAMGYQPARSGSGPRFSYAQARLLATAIKSSFDALRTQGVEITPANMRFLDALPVPALAALLWTAFWSPVAKRSLSSHSGAAPREVQMLLDELQLLAFESGSALPAISQLAAGIPQP